MIRRIPANQVAHVCRNVLEAYMCSNYQDQMKLRAILERHLGRNVRLPAIIVQALSQQRYTTERPRV
jgi:hypothetical protein